MNLWNVFWVHVLTRNVFSVNEFVKSITPELGGILPVQLLNCIHENVYAVTAAILVAACWHQSNFGLGYWNLIFFFFKSVSLKLTLQVPNWVSTQIWGGTVLNKMREWINFLWPAKGTVPLKVDLLQKLTMWTCYNLHCCNFFRIFCAQNSGSTEWGAAD